MILVLALVAVIPLTTLVLQRQTSNYTKASNPNPGFTNTITGYLEDINCTNATIKGFVCDSDNFSHSVLIRIWLIDKNGQKTFLDGSAIWASDDSPNSDLACAGTTNHSFSYTIPSNLKDSLNGGKIQIVAWSINNSGSMDGNTVELPGSPKTISCTNTTPAPPLPSAISSITSTQIAIPTPGISLSAPSSNPNFKYFGIFHGDYYNGEWGSPQLKNVNENFDLVNRGLQNIIIPVFNPGINDPAAFANYFNNYAAKARQQNVKLIIDSFFFTSGQDPSTWGTAAWETRNKEKMDLYRANQDVIYAFYFDEPYKKDNPIYKSGFIALTKRLREIFPTINTLAIEFRPIITDNYDSEFHQYITDIGFDAYESYWQSQKTWIDIMKNNVEPNKKLWLIPQAYIDDPNKGVITSGNPLKDLLSEYINYAKTDSRITGILLYDYTMEANGHDNRAIACLKEIINSPPDSQYYLEGYEDLIKNTVAELKSKTPIPVPTLLSPTQAPPFDWKISIDFKCSNGSQPNNTSSFKINYAFWPEGPGRAVYDPSWQETILNSAGGSLLVRRSEYPNGNAYLFANDIGNTYLNFYQTPDTSRFTTGGLFDMPQNTITKWSYYTVNTEPLSFTFQVPEQYCGNIQTPTSNPNSCTYTTPPSGCSYQTVQCVTTPCCKQLVCDNNLPGDLNHDKFVNLSDFQYWKTQYDQILMTLTEFLIWKNAYVNQP